MEIVEQVFLKTSKFAHISTWDGKKLGLAGLHSRESSLHPKGIMISPPVHDFSITISQRRDAV
jgi:hypothetical protein